MLLEVVANADTLAGPLEGTAESRTKVNRLEPPAQLCNMHFFFLTRFPRPSVDRRAPGSRADAVDGLNSDLVLGPLLQVLDGELPLQPVHDDMGENSTFGPCFGVLQSVANQVWVPVVLPLWQRLRVEIHILNRPR